MNTADVRAVGILRRAIFSVSLDYDLVKFERFRAIKTLTNAIRHLAFPDRAVYPKSRRGTKGRPVVRTRRT